LLDPQHVGWEIFLPDGRNVPVELYPFSHGGQDLFEWTKRILFFTNMPVHCLSFASPFPVFPAQAGIHSAASALRDPSWIPACAGKTKGERHRDTALHSANPDPSVFLAKFPP
jgi:hypothetical protein